MNLTKATINYEKGDKKVMLFINPLKEVKGKTLGFVSINIKNISDDKFVMSYANVSIVEGKDGIFLSEPTRPPFKNKDNEDVYTPYFLMPVQMKLDISAKITEHMQASK